ncbi:MAG TPA: HEAT repeat domain-containing protein [Aggregatilineales bacterium]|nr:HEAT repeat domain-containing protein [Aggregatilineales bacterium]
MFEHEESFTDLLENLRDETAPLRAALIYRLSNPTPQDLNDLRDAWGLVPVERRRLLMSRLVETSETSFEVNFREIALLALVDEDDDVRRLGIEALWEEQDVSTMRLIVRLLQQDADAAVRAAAAQALGRFVLAGELGEFPEAVVREAEAELLDVWQESSEPLEVRRRALESIAYSGRDEVPSLIQEALDHHEIKMQASAIFSMGRSGDERWENQVLAALYHPEPELRFEAARAAGELFLTAAVARLIEMLDEDDREIQQAAIWSLGEIGGQEAKRALMDFADKRDLDDDMLEAVEDALNTAALSTGEFVTYIFNMDDDDFDELEDFDGMDLDDSDFDLEDPDE